jgi:hypothetical protein
MPVFNSFKNQKIHNFHDRMYHADKRELAKTTDSITAHLALSKDSDPVVRRNLAGNENTHLTSQKNLAHDSDSEVLLILLRNPNASIMAKTIVRGRIRDFESKLTKLETALEAGIPIVSIGNLFDQAMALCGVMGISEEEMRTTINTLESLLKGTTRP